MINKLKEFIRNKTITDIYSVGFIEDEDEICEFHKILDYLYIEINSQYIIKI